MSSLFFVLICVTFVSSECKYNSTSFPSFVWKCPTLFSPSDIPFVLISRGGTVTFPFTCVILDNSIFLAYYPSINKVSFLIIVSLLFPATGSVTKRGKMIINTMIDMNKNDHTFFSIMYSCNSI